MLKTRSLQCTHVFHSRKRIDFAFCVNEFLEVGKRSLDNTIVLCLSLHMSFFRSKKTLGRYN